MMFGIPAGELVLLGGAILIAGLVSGLLAGLFGIGGSTVVIPVLYEVFGLFGVHDDVRMQLSIGTALAVTAPTLARAYFEHRAKGAVLHGPLRIWIAPAMVGVALGSAIAYVAPCSRPPSSCSRCSWRRASCSGATRGAPARRFPAPR